MTNAKSRLVRIIALALAVLMIVPMALVGCKKTTDTGVDQAAIDAAIKEALDAAQKAQDAADKAAQDAKDAQDKLAEAEKEADKLQSEIDAMKNTTTTAAPATTTAAPTTDATVINPYIATMFTDYKSEYNKLVAYYGVLVGYKAYHKADVDAIVDIIETAEVAITRAPSTDYVNQIVAALKADLEAVPTYSERVAEAYAAIDFTSNTDVIDVVFAANFAKLAYTDLASTNAANANVTFAFYNELSSAEKEIYDDMADLLEDVLEAEVDALTEGEIDYATVINQEYYRYTDETLVPNAAAVKPVDTLYGEVYDLVSVYDIAEQIAAIYDTVPGLELKTENIVWGPNGTYGDDKDIAKYITMDYTDFYNDYKREEYASLKEDFEIAFIGEAYILIEEGNYLREKLEEAKARIAQLEAAYKEYAKNSFEGKLDEIVVDATLVGTSTAAAGDFNLNYEYTNKKNVDKVYDLLVAWMNKYDIDEDSDNIDEMIGDAKYDRFMEAKAYVDGVNVWAEKAATIGAELVEKFVDAYNDDSKFSYSKFGATALALEAWLNGTWNKKTNAPNLDAAGTAKNIKINDTTKVSVSPANIALILEEVFDLTRAEISPALTYFRDVLLVQVDEANEINKAMSKITLDGLKLGSADYKKAQAAQAEIWEFFRTIGVEVEEYNAGYNKSTVLTAANVLDAVAEWDLDDVNADLINWAKYEDVLAAMKAASVDNIANASEIVKAYLKYILVDDPADLISEIHKTDDNTVKYTRTESYKGVDKRVKYEFAITHTPLVMRDYNSIKALADIKTAMQVAATKGIKDAVYVADIDGENVEFSFADAIKMYNDIAGEYYKKIMDKANAEALVIRDNAVTNGGAASTNVWMAPYSLVDASELNDATDPSKGYKHVKQYGDFAKITAILGEYAPEFRFVGTKDIDDTNSDGNRADELKKSNAKDGSVINLYNTSWVYQDSTTKVNYTYLNAVLSVDYTKYVTKSSDGIIIAFDKQEYYNAINTAVASYYKTWLVRYLRDNRADVVDIAKATVEYLVDYGFWTIDETIDVNGSKYRFTINSIGYDDATDAVKAELKLYDEEGFEVDYIKTKRANKTVYYAVDFEKNASYNPAVYDDADLNAPFNRATLDKANIKIVVKEYEKDATGAYVTSTIANAPTTLAQVLEVAESEYIYELADAAEAIKTALKDVPTNIKQYSDSSKTYVIPTAAHLDSVIAGYKAAEYYQGVKCYYDAMGKAYNEYETAVGSANVDFAVKAMYDHYRTLFSWPANYGGATTLADAIAAYEALVAEIDVYLP